MNEDDELRLPILELECYACNGRGIDYCSREQCVCCDGAGYIATELGEKFLSLMRHNLQPMLEEVS